MCFATCPGKTLRMRRFWYETIWWSGSWSVFLSQHIGTNLFSKAVSLCPSWSIKFTARNAARKSKVLTPTTSADASAALAPWTADMSISVGAASPRAGRNFLCGRRRIVGRNKSGNTGNLVLPPNPESPLFIHASQRKNLAVLPSHGDCTFKTPPKSALPMCGFLGVLLSLELLVFTADLLRPPLEFSFPRTDFPIWKFPDFFRFYPPKATKKLDFLASSRCP